MGVIWNALNLYLSRIGWKKEMISLMRQKLNLYRYHNIHYSATLWRIPSFLPIFQQQATGRIEPASGIFSSRASYNLIL